MSERFAVPSRLGRFVAYGLVGWCGEVLATGIHDYVRHRDNRLPARTSLWMFPVYGLLQPMFEPLHDSLHDRAPAPVRAAAYAAGFFGVEYASGLVLRRLLGRAPWDYTSTKRNVHGLIRLDYAPMWAAFGLALEPLHDALTGRGARPRLRSADPGRHRGIDAGLTLRSGPWKATRTPIRPHVRQEGDMATPPLHRSVSLGSLLTMLVATLTLSLPTTSAAAEDIDPALLPLIDLDIFPSSSYWKARKDAAAGVPAKVDSDTVYMPKVRDGLDVGFRYIKLIGTDSDQYGDTTWFPASSVPRVQVTCPLPASQCSGFPNPPPDPCTAPIAERCLWVRIASGYVPSNDSESHMVVGDATAGNVMWFWKACPPGPSGTGYCSTNAFSYWTSNGASVHFFASDGVDGCWPLMYPPWPNGDIRNLGHRGMPGSIDVVRFKEVQAVAGQTNGNLGRMLNLLIPNTKAQHYFPYVGHETGGSPQDIPEGTVIRMKSGVSLTGLSPGAAVVARTLKLYGAVVGDTSDTIPGNRRAAIRMENLIAEGSTYRWSDPGVEITPTSLSSILLDPANFEFIKFGYAGPDLPQGCRAEPPLP